MIIIIARIIASKSGSNNAVAAVTLKLAGYSLSAFQIYYPVTKSGLAVDKLRQQEKIIYNLSYSKNIEILYFIIEPKTFALIYVTKINDHTNADALIETLATLFYKD